MRRIKIWVYVLWCFFRSFGSSKADIMDKEMTIDYLVKKRKTFIRFGDGEFGIYKGKDIHYQPWSKELQDEFLRIKSDYEAEGEKPYLLGVPYKYIKKNGLSLIKKRVLVASWAAAKLCFQKEFRQDVLYGDAFVFAKGNKEEYCRLWKDYTHVFFVHNNRKYAEIFEKKYDISTEYIPVPSYDAYSEIKQIEQCILQNVTTYKQKGNDNFVILVSAGPAGKVIAYDLCKLGYCVIDTGHCWDEPLEEW